MRNRFFIAAFLVVALMRSPSLQAANADDGKTLFQSHCTSCHMIDQRLVGPALKNIYKSQSEGWIISFVHSPEKKIHSGDTAAANIYQRFQPIIMPDQTDLNDDQIKSIIAYIKAESEKIITPTTPVATIPVEPTITWSSYYFWCGVLTIITILLFGLIILTRAYKVKQEYLLSKIKK